MLAPDRRNATSYARTSSMAISFLALSSLISYASFFLQGAFLLSTILINYSVFLVFWRYRFSHSTSYVDPGLIFISVVVIYVFLPLAELNIFNFNIGPGQDTRLFHIALDDRIISSTLANANGIICGFGACYLFFRSPKMPSLGIISKNKELALWFCLFLSSVTPVALLISGSRGGEYTDEYIQIQSLPLIAIQIINIMINLLYVSIFGLTLILLKNKRFVGLFFLIAYAMAIFLISSRSRTPVVLTIFSIIVGWDYVVRRISAAQLMVIVSLLVAVFLAAGAYRGNSGSLAAVIGQSEFMAVFVTALDVRQIYLTGSSTEISTILFLADVFRFIPQQFLPFEKIDLADWYVSIFFPQYKAAGGGFAFGILAEAALSGGILEAILRGMALGFALSMALNLTVRKTTLWSYVIYIWLTVSVYQCFRDTTFTLVGRFAFQFLPALLICAAVAVLLSGRRTVSNYREAPPARGAQTE